MTLLLSLGEHGKRFHSPITDGDRARSAGD